jgi:hypothetical protein
MANIKLFENKRICSHWDEQEQKWYFSVVDVIEALTDSDKPRDYWYRLKSREKESSRIELSTFCRQLKIESSDGKNTMPNAPLPKDYSELFNPSLPLKLSHSNDG